MRGVANLGVELETDEAPFWIEKCRDFGRGGAGEHLEPVRDALHQIAMTHPDGLPLRRAHEHRFFRHHLELGKAVLAVRGGLHVSAEVAGHQMKPVADPEHRNPEIENFFVDLERTVFEDTCGPARQHDGDRCQRPDLGARQVAALDHGLDPEFPQSARDQLRVLRPEIEDENDLMLHGRSPALWRQPCRGGGYQTGIMNYEF